MAKWIPLESEPQVLTDWAKKAGLATDLYEFSDVLGLDPELLMLVSQPVQAVILVFPISNVVEQARKEVDQRISQQGGQHPVDPTVVFIKQTIPNACGTIAILHAILNTDVTLIPGTPLVKFQGAVINKTAAERGKLLEETDVFHTIHEQMAKRGQSAIPRNNDTDLHYTVFVSAPEGSQPEDLNAGKEQRDDAPSQRVLELDGRRPVPVDHGPLSEKGLLDSVAKIVQEKYIATSNSLQFSLIALAPTTHD